MFKLLLAVFLLAAIQQPISGQLLLSNYASWGDCNFYQELEKVKNCGKTGYLIGYGGKYCVKFGEKSDSFNQDVKFLCVF